MYAHSSTSKKLSVTRAALIAITAGLSLGASVAQAQIVDSGPVNIVIPDTIDGVYLNVVTGATGGTGAAVAGWDLNPYSALSGQFNLWHAETNGWFNPQAVVGGNYNLPIGTVVQGANTAFFRPGGGTNVAPNFNLNSNDNYLGFRFTNEAGGTNHFGYMQVQFGATAATRSIVRYWFNATPNTAITVAAPGGGATPPQFGFTPAPGSTVTGTGGGAVGSTSNLSITPSIATAGSGTGAAATTTLTCTAPTAPFAGFTQTVTAVGTGAITGGPLAGTCTRGATAATATLTCSEVRGTVATPRTWTLSCPAGTAPPVASVPVNATSAWSLIALMLALFGFAAVAVRRQG